MVLGVDLFFSLFNNLAIFIALVAIYGHLITNFNKSVQFQRQISLGLAFGLFAIGCMYAKIPVFEGVIVDQRNAIITLSGVFGGPVSAILSAFLAGSFRVYLGGGGALAGVVGVTLAATAGIILNRQSKPFGTIPRAAASAFFATLLILPGFLFVKDLQTGWDLMKAMSLPYGLAIFLGIFLVGLLLHREENQRNVEMLLIASEERFRQAVLNAPFPVILYADDDEILLINDVWTELSGYTSQDIPTIKAWVDLAYGLTGPAVYEKIKAVYTLTKRQDEGAFTINTKGGEQRTWSFSSAPLGHMEDGRKLFISMAADITEQKTAEREIHRLHNELEQRVIQRTAQLEAANKELEAFSYSVSHDLRAPLRHIDGYVDLLVSRCRDQLSEKGQHYVNTIADSARKAGELIDDLLRFSRCGRQELNLEIVDMNRVFQESVEILEKAHGGRTIEWVIDDLPEVKGDPSLLRQVWINLLENAIKYTSTCERATVVVSARSYADKVEFTIKDNGVGFEMKYAGKLFGVFQRLHSSAEFEGTGIGLATVQRILHRHDGNIRADAELNQGASFVFTLPKAKGVA